MFICADRNILLKYIEEGGGTKLEICTHIMITLYKKRHIYSFIHTYTYICTYVYKLQKHTFFSVIPDMEEDVYFLFFLTFLKTLNYF